MFQHTAARRRLVGVALIGVYVLIVSTHSRPKAAGCLYRTEYQGTKGFNTQPPEGGWDFRRPAICHETVSTHSRPKAAGNRQGQALR